MPNLGLSEVRALHSLRVANSWTPPAVALPQLPETAATELFERVVEAERDLVSPDLTEIEYTIGTARWDDDLFFASGQNVLFSAEHATVQQRTRKKDGVIFSKPPDYGTAGLGVVLQQDLLAALVVPRGRQTSDANHTIHHPLKDILSREVESGCFRAHASLHGARAGSYRDFDDERGIDVHLGIGGNPNDESIRLADKIAALAKELGLRVVINGQFVAHDSWEPLVPKRDSDEALVLRSFAAKNPATTRAHVQTAAETAGIEMATVQIELSEFLRLQPGDTNVKDKTARELGVYLGYTVINTALQTKVTK